MALSLGDPRRPTRGRSRIHSECAALQKTPTKPLKLHPASHCPLRKTPGLSGWTGTPLGHGQHHWFQSGHYGTMALCFIRHRNALLEENRACRAGRAFSWDIGILFCSPTGSSQGPASLRSGSHRRWHSCWTMLAGTVFPVISNTRAAPALQKSSQKSSGLRTEICCPNPWQSALQSEDCGLKA